MLEFPGAQPTWSRRRTSRTVALRETHVLGNAEQKLGAERTSGVPSGLAVWHWSTRDIAPRDRVASWHEVHAKAIARRRISVFSDEFGDVDVRLARVGVAGRQIGLQRMRLTDGSIATRERALLNDGSDDVILHVQLRGARELAQMGRTAFVPAGAAVYSFNAEPSTIRLPAGSDFVSIALPHILISARVPRIEDAVARPLASNHPTLRLLVAYLASMDLRPEGCDALLGQMFASHIIDLASHLAGSVLHDEPDNARHGLLAARLRAIKADIAANLTDDVSVRTLAARHGVTSRYVHKLFEREGLTFSNYVCSLRLDRVHRHLTDPHQQGKTIAELVYATGFGDVSTFNRAYRARYGMTPSETRRLAMAGPFRKDTCRD